MTLKVIQDSNGRSELSEIKSVLAVAAGKGGVGKSSIAVNLALFLKEKGYQVGLLDADVYGPSLLQMLKEEESPTEDPLDSGRILPGKGLGLPFISVAHFKKNASIVRAPIANQLIDQFLHTVYWGKLDYLIIDFPPGTGDIQLSLMQKAKIQAAIMVTTPQIVSAIDVRKAIQHFQKMHIPVLGIIENMSYYVNPFTLQKELLFGQGASNLLTEEFHLPILGKIPLDPLICQMADEGKSLFKETQPSFGMQAFNEAFAAVLEELKKVPLPYVNARIKDSFHLEITLDEKPFVLSAYAIQKNCPCARCEKRKNSLENVAILQVSYMGSYALKIAFSSGCSLGIYPLLLLKKISLLCD